MKSEKFSSRGFIWEFDPLKSPIYEEETDVYLEINNKNSESYSEPIFEEVNIGMNNFVCKKNILPVA